MHLEEFARGRSLPHRLDPRVKLAAALVWSCLLAGVHSLAAAAAGLAIGLLLLLCARLPARALCARLAAINIFIVLFWLTLPFSTPGETMFTLGPLEASRQGLESALLVTLKCNAVITALTALLGTSTVFALVHALRHFSLPEKLAHMFFLCFRYFQIIHGEWLRLREAARVRCFTPGTNARTYAVYAQMLGMLLVRSLDRAERVNEAMLCRGYAGRLWVFDHFALKRADFFFALACLPACALLVFLGW